MKMKRPIPELIDDENPEWTEEDFAKAVPFSGLPAELKTCSPHPSASGKRRIPNLSANPRPDQCGHRSFAGIPEGLRPRAEGARANDGEREVAGCGGEWQRRTC